MTRLSRKRPAKSLLATLLTTACLHTAMAAPVDLCAGLVQDKAPHPMTSLAKPAVGQTVTDPEFGTTIRRLSNSGKGNVIKPVYSTVPAWNADESYLVLYHTGHNVPGGAGHHLYDGKTYAHLGVLNIDPPDLEQFYWHATDPSLILYVDSHNNLTQYDVKTKAKTVLHTFACSGQVSGGSDPMYTSWDSDVIGLTCGGEGFSYRLSSNTEGKRVAVAHGVAPIAGASGQRMYLAAQDSEVLTLGMGLIYTFAVNSQEHASLGQLADGSDTHNAVSFGGKTQGSLVVSDMSGQKGSRVVVGPDTGYPYPPGGTHISAVALQRPGWVAVSVVGATSGKATLNQEIVLADTNPGGKVCRIAHHRSWGDSGKMGYWAEPHGVVSPSGTRVLFGSDWGGGKSVDAYVVELPGYTP
jgi:hypothetical protein